MRSAQPAHAAARRSERLELADDLTVEAELDVGVDALLERIEPQLLQAPDLALRELLAREIGERRAPPERERRPSSSARSPAERARLDEQASKRRASTASGSTART